jgi:F-type H+-transporting ATPase subunit alpha
LKQAQFSPAPVGEQVAIIYASINGVMDKVDVSKVKAFENEFMLLLKAQHPEVLQKLGAGKLEDDVMGIIKKVGKELAEKYV